MFPISVAVIAVALLLSSGRSLPVPVVDLLDEYLSGDGSSTNSLVAIGYGIGIGAAFTPLRLYLRYFATVVHELGHAFMAGALLARPKSIHIHPSSSGLAIYELSPNWGRFRATLVSAAGYPAPSIAALAAINAVQQGRTMAWAVFSVAVLSLSVVLLIRNLWGFVWTASVIGASYYGYDKLPVDLVGAVVAGISGYLALSSVQFAWTQLTLTRRFRGAGVDAESIEAFTKIPSKVVATGHLLVTLVLGYLSLKLALGPKWSEIDQWIRDLY